MKTDKGNRQQVGRGFNEVIYMSDCATFTYVIKKKVAASKAKAITNANSKFFQQKVTLSRATHDNANA